MKILNCSIFVETSFMILVQSLNTDAFVSQSILLGSYELKYKKNEEQSKARRISSRLSAVFMPSAKCSEK